MNMKDVVRSIYWDTIKAYWREEKYALIERLVVCKADDLTGLQAQIGLLDRMLGLESTIKGDK